MRRSRSEERRANLVAIGWLLGILAILGAFAYRPATVLGVDDDSLASSVAGEAALTFPEGGCEEDAGTWRCSFSDRSGSVETYAVSTRAFGCWDAVPAGLVKPELSGCISAFDLLGLADM